MDDRALLAMLTSVEACLGTSDTWDVPDGYDSVGLAMIDAVWSIGVRYQSVENVIARYRAERLAAGQDPEADRPQDVRRFIKACGGPEGFAARVRNRQRTSTRNGILKAEAVLHEARILEAEGVGVPADLAGAGEERLDHLRQRWSTVPGQASGVSWRAFAMLVGLADVKPDRMIRRYVASALGRTGRDRGRRRGGARPGHGDRSAPRRRSACARLRDLGLPEPALTGRLRSAR